MTTIEQTKAGEGVGVGVSYALEVEGESLKELLEGAITHAHKDKDLPALNAVMLEGERGYLSARATDRYRLIVGKIEVMEGELSPSLISLSDIKRIVALAKEGKISNKVTFNRIGDLLTVSAGGNSLTLTIVEASYPPSFDDLLNKGEVSALDTIAFNPSYFSDYAKIVGKGVQVKVTFKGERMPITIGLVGDKVEWRALLMPMRYKD